MKKIIMMAVATAVLFTGCESPTGEQRQEEEKEYRFEYEMKNDFKKPISMTFCREFAITRTTVDSKGKGFYVDSSMTTFETINIPVGEIVTIGSDNDTLILCPQYLLNKVEGRFRHIKYGNGMKNLSDDVYE